MRKIVLIISCILFCTSFTVAFSQTALKVGDRLPLVKLEKIMNYNKQTITLSEFKDKILILDFWSTWCTSCIEHMPAMAALQKKYKDKLVFVYVDNEKRPTVEKFFSKRKELLELGLPLMIADTLLGKLFPHESVPHVIWVGNDKTVKAITSGEDITAQHIEQLIKTGSIDLQVKKDIHIDREQSLYTLGNVFTSNLKYYSVLTDQLVGGGGKLKFSFIDNNRMRLYITNQTILSLYVSAYRFQVQLNTQDWNTRIKVESTVDTFHHNNRAYCYEVIAPRKDSATDMRRMYSFMQQDLDRYFNMRSRVEERRTSCYVIRCRNCVADSSRTKKMIAHYFTDHKVLENCLASSAIGEMKLMYPFDKPVIYEGPKDLRLTMKMRNHYETMEQVIEDLNAVGLELKEEEQPLNMLVISDN